MKFLSSKAYPFVAGMFFIAAAVSPACAQLAVYNFNNSSAPWDASMTAPGITASAIAPTPTYTWFWNATVSPGLLQLNPGTVATSLSQALVYPMYVSFTVSSPIPMNLSSLTLDGGDYQFSSPGGYAVESSADGYASIISTANFTTQLPTFATYTVDLSGAAFQGVTNITFRIYGYNAIYGYDNLTTSPSMATVGVSLSAANTTISASPSSITANGTSTSTLTVQAKDS